MRGLRKAEGWKVWQGRAARAVVVRGLVPRRNEETGLFERHERVFREVGAPARGNRPARRPQPSLPTGSAPAAQAVTRHADHGAIAGSDLCLPMGAVTEGAAPNARAALCLTRASSGRASSAGTGW